MDASRNGHSSISLPGSESSLRSETDLQAALAKALGNPGGAPDSPISLELIRVSVKKGMPKPRLVERPLQGPDSSHARKGTRRVLWGSSKGEAQIYNWEALRPGNRVNGCAVLEDVNSTYFIPEGWEMIMDRFGNGSLSRVSPKV
jgi:N-methylhydantoinase A/oxoprolinase/acetone carboxylase beta subunit